MMASYATGARIEVLHGNRDAAARRLDEGAEAARALKLPRLATRIANEQVRLGFTSTYVTEPAAGEGGVAILAAELREDSAIRMLMRSAMARRVAAASWRVPRRCAIPSTPPDAPRAASRAQLLLASCLAASGKFDAAEDALVPVLAKYADGGLIRPLRDEGPWIASLIRALYHDLRAGHWKDGWPSVSPAFLRSVLDD